MKTIPEYYFEKSFEYIFFEKKKIIEKKIEIEKIYIFKKCFFSIFFFEKKKIEKK